MMSHSIIRFRSFQNDWNMIAASRLTNRNSIIFKHLKYWKRIWTWVNAEQKSFTKLWWIKIKHRLLGILLLIWLRNSLKSGVLISKHSLSQRLTRIQPIKMTLVVSNFRFNNKIGHLLSILYTSVKFKKHDVHSNTIALLLWVYRIQMREVVRFRPRTLVSFLGQYSNYSNS